MLIANNLKKIYKPKKGVPVVALDNLSLQLPDKGMVFLLGKSGSGKSTLLNILGGLDTYTSGEIVINGKSSKDFKPGDFDSYRNTYIGFIFQEFNLLDEYTVGKNIALALELQHKTSDRKEVEKLMESVGLEKSHFDRETNELSGGQKQRVAIARALVKSPDIIMADEPTGNLDSQTSKQIFDGLKELSEEKLVIVVSHDRENAETYGDRVIELADGKIISDTAAAAQPQSDKGAFKLIKSKLPIKDSIKMGASGLKLKKVRLAFTIFLSIIAFTVFGLFSTFSAYDQYKTEIATIKRHGENTLLISDVYSTDETFRYTQYSTGLTYDQIAHIEELTGNKTLKLFDDRFQQYFAINSFAKGPNHPYYARSLSNLLEVGSAVDANLVPVAEGSRLPGQFNYQEIAISDWVAESFIKFGLNKGGEEKKINSYADLLNQSIEIQSVNSAGMREDKVNLTITGVYKTDIDKEKYEKYKLKSEVSIADTYFLGVRNKLIFSMGFVAPGFEFPKTTAYTQIFLPYYEFLTANNIEVLINTANSIDILGEEQVYLGGRNLSDLDEDEIIVSAGILRSAYNLTYGDLEQLKETFDNATEEHKSISATQNLKHIGDFKIAGVRTNNYDTHEIYLNNQGLSVLDRGSGALLLSTGGFHDLGLVSTKTNTMPSFLNWVWQASNYDLFGLPIFWGTNAAPKQSLAGDEIIITNSILRQLIDDAQDYSELQLRNAFDEMEKTMQFGLVAGFGIDFGIINGKTVKVVGVSFEEEIKAPLFGDDIIQYAKDINSTPLSVVIKLSDDWKKNNELFEYLLNENYSEQGVYTKIKPFSMSTEALDAVSTWTSLFKNIFLYASLALSFFAGLMLMNFIGISIADKKKSIGILRAIGARSADVFKIFYSEGLIIASIIFALSFVCVVAVSEIINGLLTMRALIPSIIQAMLMATLTYSIMTVSTMVPIYKISVKKPIDAINDR